LGFRSGFLHLALALTLAPQAWAKTARLLELERRDAASIAQLNADEAELDSLRSQLADTSSGPDAVRLSAAIRVKERITLAERGRLQDYLAAVEDSRLVDTLSGGVTDQASRDSLVKTIDCLQARSLASPELAALYNRSLEILSHSDDALARRLARKTPGYKDRDCAPSGPQTECWDTAYGLPYYVTRGSLRISMSCLIHPASWRSFPLEPAEYIRASDEATGKLSSCLAGLNSEDAESVALHVSTVRPFLTCKEGGPVTDDDHECAHAVTGGEELQLTRPSACHGLGKTIFHELLHLGGLGNLATRRHNEPGCYRYDAVYACSDLCFPAERDRQVTGYSCEHCADDRHQGRCAGLSEIDYDESFRRCTTGGAK
jgi:hypothetical protein